MTDFVNPGSDKSSGHPRATPRDPGAFRRAVELASAGLPGTRPQGAACSEPGASPDALLQSFSEATGAVARLRALDAVAVLRTVAESAVVVVPTGLGWLVVRRRAAVHVTAAGEEHLRPGRRRIARVMGAGARDAIVLEPRLGLASLQRDATGSPSPWSRLRALMAMEGPELLSLVVYSVVLGLLSLAVPVAVQVLVNTIAFGSLLQPLVVLAALLFGVLALSGTIQVLEWYAVEIMQRRLFVRVAEDFARRLVAVRYDVHDVLDGREMTNRFFEVVTLQKAVGRLVLEGLGLALQTLVGLVLLAFYHPVLLVFDVAIVLGLGVVVALGAGAVPSAIAESAAKYRVAAWLESVAAAPALFKSPSAALFAAIRADGLTRDYLAARRRHYSRVLRQLVGGVGVQVVSMVSLLGLGGWLVMQGELTLGQLVAAELVVGVVAAGVAKVGKHFEAVYDLLGSLDKVGKVVDLPCDETAPVTTEHGGRIGITFDSLALRSGTKPTGAVAPGGRALARLGRAEETSELLEVLAGLREPADGAVHASGDVPTPLSPHARRSRAMLVGTADVVDGSVLDNLRLADPGLDEERALGALAAVDLEEAVAALPSGLHTRVLPRGGPLSPSERVRLALARAFVAPPELLLVDGALDVLGLDPTRTATVLERVFSPDAPWTLIVASREPAVRDRCGDIITERGAS